MLRKSNNGFSLKPENTNEKVTANSQVIRHPEYFLNCNLYLIMIEYLIILISGMKKIAMLK